MYNEIGTSNITWTFGPLIRDTHSVSLFSVHPVLHLHTDTSRIRCVAVSNARMPLVQPISDNSGVPILSTFFPFVSTLLGSMSDTYDIRITHVGQLRQVFQNNLFFPLLRHTLGTP
jgi:hypothetical protein